MPKSNFFVATVGGLSVNTYKVRTAGLSRGLLYYGLHLIVNNLGKKKQESLKKF